MTGRVPGRTAAVPALPTLPARRKPHILNPASPADRTTRIGEVRRPAAGEARLRYHAGTARAAGREGDQDGEISTSHRRGRFPAHWLGQPRRAAGRAGRRAGRGCPAHADVGPRTAPADVLGGAARPRFRPQLCRGRLRLRRADLEHAYLPRLRQRLVGLVSTAGGIHGLQAVNSMDLIARACGPGASRWSCRWRSRGAPSTPTAGWRTKWSGRRCVSSAPRWCGPRASTRPRAPAITRTRQLAQAGGECDARAGSPAL
jgi:hypothetical protein